MSFCFYLFILFIYTSSKIGVFKEQLEFCRYLHRAVQMRPEVWGKEELGLAGTCPPDTGPRCPAACVLCCHQQALLDVGDGVLLLLHSLCLKPNICLADIY